jgi:hypothetical protein
VILITHGCEWNAIYCGKSQKLSRRQYLMRRVSGRNRLAGRTEEVRISGLMAEITLSIGEQHITSLNGLHSRDTYNQHASHSYLMGYAAVFEPAQELRRARSYVRNKQARDILVNVLETIP